MDQGAKKHSFRIIGRVVMAMKRFQAAISPRYSYGKRCIDSNEHDTRLKQAHAQKVSPSGRFSGHTASGRTISGRPTNAGQAHGHKGDLLFRALPEIEAEAQ